MLREHLNEHPKITGLMIGALILTISIISWIELRGFGRPNGPSRLYYTTDDSSATGAMAAVFIDEGTKAPPFDHNGKPAYLAYVFSADGGKTKFIGYLQRYTPKGKQMKEEMISGDRAAAVRNVPENETELKKPGDAEWVQGGDNPGARRVMKLIPPAGQDAAKLESIFP